MELISSRNDLATFARLTPLPPGLRGLVPKLVPSRAQIAGAVGKAVRNPVKAVKDGLARDGAAMRVLRSQGRTRWGTAWKGTISGGKELLKQKDLVVNTGGFIGSNIGASIGGFPGKLAGDNIGAIVTRRSYDDFNAVRKGLSAAKQATGGRLAKVKTGIKTTLQEGRKNFTHKKTDYLGDQIGWGIGNTVAESTPNVPIPLRGGIMAMRSAPAITKGIVDVSKGAPIGQTAKEVAKKVRKDLHGPSIVKRGNARERLLRRKINRKLGELRGDFSRRLRHAYFSRLPSR